MEPSAAGESFGSLLRRYIVAAGLSQEALAARSGVTKDAISMLERGVRSAPRASTLDRLARSLRLGDTDRRLLRETVSGTSPNGRRLPGVRPPTPTAWFVGRDRELADMGRRLGPGRPLAVHGLGGVGKTQLVARYVQLRRSEYSDGVFWVRADRGTTLLSDLVGLAWQLELPERLERQQESQIEAVQAWLRTHDRWLLVLDNLEPNGLDVVQQRLAPAELPGHIVVTSRTPMYPNRIALQPLPREMATRFLLERTGQSDRVSACVVAETLGCLPLALEQAAAYLL